MFQSEEIERQIAEDLENNPNLRRFDYESEFGSPITVLMPKHHCLFCQHCSEWLYDYTGGPYLFICELGKAFDDEADDCEFFVDEDDVEVEEDEVEVEEEKPMCLSNSVQSVIDDCDLPLKLAFIQKLAPEVYWRHSGYLSDYIDEMYMDAVNEEWTAEED